MLRIGNKKYAMAVAVESGTSDHTQLTNRDADEQHPISAITDLQDTLDEKQDTISDLSTIRSGASAGATAIQPNDNITQLNNNAGYITGITSSDVTTALGYTPYNSTNPSGYITSSALSGYATQTWVGQQGYITSAVDDSSTTSTTLGWSASKLNTTIGNVEALILAL